MLLENAQINSVRHSIRADKSGLQFGNLADKILDPIENQKERPRTISSIRIYFVSYKVGKPLLFYFQPVKFAERIFNRGSGSEVP